jgi:methyltransferase (TIGR00027 family)
MRKNRASNTAKMVALWRALASAGHTSIPHFSDPFAAELLTGGWRRAYPWLRARLDGMPAQERERVIARYDPVAIRVAVIDAELSQAVASGCQQVVILGAGFDTRAYRLDAVRGTRLFEVDHPATQREKRELARNLPTPEAELIWTEVDFEHDSLAQRLAQAGHDPQRPTVWLWEGVVMYLADAAVASTLAAIFARSAKGSVLILHYHEPSAGKRTRFIRGLLLALAGEPQIGVRSRVAMQQLVERAGFQLERDLDIVAQARQVDARAPDNDLARVSRILIARRA